MFTPGKWLRAAAIAIVSLIIIFGLFTFFNYKIGEEDSNTINTKIYFLNPTTYSLEYENRSISKLVKSENGEVKAKEDTDFVEEVLYELIITGPKSANLVKTFPQELKIAREVTLFSTYGEGGATSKNKTVEIVFSKEYKDLSPAAEILLRGSLVYTLTELDFVKNVEIFIENGEAEERLTQANNQIMGPMNRDNVLLSPNITSDSVIRKQVILYFANKEMTGLVPEVRLIEVPSPLDSSEEKAILEQLRKGPSSKDLIGLIPSDIKINDVNTTTDKTCYIDLSSVPETSRGMYNETIQKLTLYSIINTLTIPDKNVKRVQFLINGEKVSNLNQAYEKDESLIIKTNIKQDED